MAQSFHISDSSVRPSQQLLLVPFLDKVTGIPLSLCMGSFCLTLVKELPHYSVCSHLSTVHPELLHYSSLACYLLKVIFSQHFLVLLHQIPALYYLGRSISTLQYVVFSYLKFGLHSVTLSNHRTSLKDDSVTFLKDPRHF